MANIPTPDVAKGTAAGAKQDKKSTDFHDGPFINVADHGAALDGRTDDSGAIKSALQEAASTGGAAYIPDNAVAGVRGFQGLEINSSENGAALIGEGANSVIKCLGGQSSKYHGIRIHGRNAGVQNIYIANIRVNANRGHNSQDSNAIGLFDHGNSDGPIMLENVWAHSATNTGIKVEMENTTLRNCSAWDISRWHGTSCYNTNITVENYLAWNTGQYGIDLSSGSGVNLNRFICTDCGHNLDRPGGMKYVNNKWANIRNGVLINNRGQGIKSTGGNGKIEIDNVLTRDNDDMGMQLGHGDVTVGKMWAVNNTGTNLNLYNDVSFDATDVEAGRSDNHGLDVVHDTVSGSIQTLVASDNAGKNVISKNVSIGVHDTSACNAPSVEEIVGEAGRGETIRYYDGSAWKDAVVKYHNGNQFNEVSVTVL
jgi:hypothetical protein